MTTITITSKISRIANLRGVEYTATYVSKNGRVISAKAQSIKRAIDNLTRKAPAAIDTVVVID